MENLRGQLIVRENPWEIMHYGISRILLCFPRLLFCCIYLNPYEES